MADMIRQYSSHALIDTVVTAMKQKYIKYWGKIRLLYAFGIVVDPRFRFNALEVFSNTLGEALGLSETDVAEHLSTLKSQMFEVFSIYENRYNDGTTEPAAPQQQSQQQLKLMRIFFQQGINFSCCKQVRVRVKIKIKIKIKVQVQVQVQVKFKVNDNT